MRWVVRLVPLVALLAWFHRLTAAGPLEARATLGLGALLVVTWLAAKIVEPLHLPRITAFLVAGFCLGPSWLNLIRADEVGALSFIADASVALIALAVGCELPIATVRAEGTRLARLAWGTTAFPFAAVALVVLTVSHWFPVTVHQSFRDAVGVALALGVLAGASSPAATLGVMDEVRARGPFARTLLAVSAMKDVATIVVLAAGLALARVLGRTGAVDSGVALTSLFRLIASVGAGAVIGTLGALYTRRVRRDLDLLLLALAGSVAFAARALPLEPILVALSAGVCLASAFPGESARVRIAIDRWSLGVYAIAFGLAGAALRVDVLDGLWPWALLLIGLRVVALRYGTIWAGRAGAVPQALAADGWLGLVSQGGVALVLARTARAAFPGWGVSLEALAVAMAAVQETIGPVCFRWALSEAGEIAGEPAGHGVEAADPSGASAFAAAAAPRAVT